MMSEKIVLLVEDNSDDVELTLRSFKKHGIKNKVVIARDGVEALDYLFCRGAYAGRKIEETPALILLDLKLPKVDGLEVLREIRSNPYTKRTPVVMLTSSGEEKDKIDSYDLGANSYVRKPVDFDRLLEVTRQLGLYWLVMNEPPPMKTSVNAATRRQRQSGKV
jgi:CheY-like chemotaxis protein